MRRLLTFGARGGKRLTGFALNQILLGVASLVLMPAIIGAAGLEVWSSIVLAQALAQIAATVVGCGYGVDGPAIIATLSDEDGVNYFRLAERIRLVIAVPSFAFMIGAMFVIPNPDPVIGILGGIHLVINAFSASFFYVGRAAPRWQLWAEICPRVSLMFAGAICLALGVPLVISLALPPLGALLGVAVSNATIRRSVRHVTHGKSEPRAISIRAEFRNQLSPAASSMLRGFRDALPVLVVTAVAAELVGAFGVFDRLVRQVLGVMSAVTSTLQGWVPRRMAAEGGTRPAVVAMLIGFAIACVAFVLFILLGSPLITWLSAGTVIPTSAETALCGSVIATSILIPINAYACLVPLGIIRGVILGAIAGIVAVAIVCPIMLSLERSVAFALGALTVGNLVQLLAQTWLMRSPLASGVRSLWRDGLLGS